MIAFTYATSGILLAITGALFAADLLNATQQDDRLERDLLLRLGRGGLGLSHRQRNFFPVEIRALAIAVFYAAGTALGGVLAPAFFGFLISTGSRNWVFVGYLVGAGLMIFAAVVQAIWGVAAEGKPLELVAKPLSSA